MIAKGIAGRWRRSSLWVSESGQTLVLAALAMVMLVGVLGLSVDAGVLRYQKRRMQNAADAAALGAALETFACAGVANCAVMRTAAQSALAENGMTSAALQTNCAVPGTQLTLTVNNPPCALPSDPGRGNPAYVEAVMTGAIPTVFAQVLGVRSVNVAARAEAALKPSPCVYWLSQYASAPSYSTLNQSDNYACATYVGSSYNVGSGASSSGSQYYVAGTSANSSGSVSPAPVFNYLTLGDPLAGVPAPAFGGCQAVNASLTTSSPIYPGVYCGNTNISTSASATVSLAPGTYIILGSLSINGPTLTGSGVTIFLSQGNGYSAGPSTISNVYSTMSAPTSGSLQGILIYSDRSIPAGQGGLTVMNWNPNSTQDGIYYLPGQELTAVNVPLRGVNYFGAVADYASMHNVTFVPSTNYTSLANGSPFKTGGAALIQ